MSLPSPLDLEAQQLSTELLQLDVERATVIGELRPLLGLGAGDTPVIRGELPPVSRIPAGGATPLARADFQAAQSTAEAARENAALARTSRWEDIGVGLRVAREQEDDPAEGYMRDNFVGLRITIPFPLWNDQTGRIREATAAAARAQKDVEALDVTIRAEAAAARDTMAALARIVGQIDKELLPRAVQVEEQLRAGYSTGQTALLEVLRARDRRLLLQRQRLDALRDYHLARVRHSSATGRLHR
jgi:cobalt-zinc-cadmium efflux system outer membrane protein